MNHYENKRNICYPSGGNPTFDPPAILIGWSRFIIYYIHGLITRDPRFTDCITQDANLMRLIQIHLGDLYLFATIYRHGLDM